MVKKTLLAIKTIMAWLLAISFAILLMTVLFIQFWLFPNINQYKNAIAKQLTHELQQTVTIGHIKAFWRGLRPNVTIDQVVILDAEKRPALTLNRSQIALSWLSFAVLEPRFAEINIYSPKLDIRKTQDGTIWVAGMQINLDTANPAAANWLLRQRDMHVIDAEVRWTDETREAPPLVFTAVDIQVASPPWKKILNNHHIKLTAQSPILGTSPFTLEANVYGNDVSQWQTWRGKLAGISKNVNLAALKPWIDYPLAIERGEGAIYGELYFAQNKMTALNGNLSLNNVILQASPLTASDKAPAVAELGKTSGYVSNELSPYIENPQSIAIDKLSTEFDWLNKAVVPTNPSAQKTTSYAMANYTLTLKRLNLTLENQPSLKDANISLAVKNATLDALTARIDYANLRPLSVALSSFPLAADLQQMHLNISPSGELRQVRAQWNGYKNRLPDYQFSADFNALTIKANPTTRIGFSGLKGQIDLNEKKGKLLLNTDNATIDASDVLRWPLAQNKLNGTILWRIQQDKSNAQTPPVVQVNAREFSLRNPHLMGKVNLAYRIDAQHGDSIDLSAQFEKAQAKFASFYYPIILGPATLNWLDTSILGGEVNNIAVVMKGKLRDFPFTNKQHLPDAKLGIFKVTGNLSDGLIEYGKGWPVIEKLSSSLLFEGKRMELNATAGRILGNDIVKSSATIAQLDADNPLLKIISEAKGPLAEGVKFINKSPVAEITQGFTKSLVTSGNGKLNLALQIPLKNIDDASYQGHYAIKNGSMQNISLPLLTNIDGTVHFTEKEFTATNMKANLFGAPAAFSIATNPDSSVRVTAKGVLNQTAINQLLQNAAMFITGTTQWVADILIKQALVNINIRSDLFGIQSSLPAPFNKEANERTNLRINQKQGESSESTYVQIHNNVHAKAFRSLQNNGYTLEQLALHFGEITGENTNFNGASNTKGLSVTGQLNYLDVDAWLTVNQQMRTISNVAVKSTQPQLPIQKLNIDVKTLEIFDKKIHQLSMQHKTGGSGLQFSVQSQEITGDLHWLPKSSEVVQTSAEANGKLIARLSQLIIPSNLNQDKTSQMQKNASVPQKAVPVKDFYQLKQDYPALDITAAQFELGEKKLGALTLNAYPKNDNWVIQKLLLSSADSTLNVQGEWNNWVKSPNTRLNVAWEIKDLGNTIKRFGYPDTIKEGAGQLSGQLNWPGSPHEFNSAGLNGNLNFEMRNGQILKAQPGVGRLFGLLSLQSLPRRLTLDFRDLFNSGFAFDTIKANVKLNNGVLSSDDFVMAGPAADVSIKGQASIPDETQRMRVKVNPRISDSISLAALAGGPLIGAMAFLAQKILKDPLNKIASTEYNIGGTWDNPIELGDERSKNIPQKENVLQ